MPRSASAQLELPLAGPEPIPDLPGASRPAVACARCGWYAEPHAPCPVCHSPGAGPRLPPLRRPRREPAP